MNKRCPHCGLTKTSDSFYKHKNGKIYCWCILCEKEKSVYRKEYKSAYYRKNRNRILDYCKEWNANNRDYLRKYYRAYRFRIKDDLQGIN